MRVLIAWAAACLVFGAPLQSQEYGRMAVFGSAGWGTWWDDEGAPVRGFNAGAGIGRRLLPQFAVEGEAMVFRGTRGYFGPAPVSRARGVLVTANALLYVLRGERAQVFVLLGAGGARSTTETRFDGQRYTRSGIGFVANAGAGVKFALGNRWSLRPEVRVAAATAGSSVTEALSNQLRFSLGLEYQW